MSCDNTGPLGSLAAVLVRWQRERLLDEDLQTLLSVADSVVVVDNARPTSGNHCPGGLAATCFSEDLMQQALRLGIACERGAPDAHPPGAPAPGPARLVLLTNDNRGYLAGAYNHALSHLQARPEPPSHVLWLDEDSELEALPAWLHDPRTRRHFEQPDVAAFAPAYRDRATGLRGRQMVWAEGRLRYAEREARGSFETAFLINSMSIWRFEVLLQAGGYDEALGLDHIDTDLCLWAHAQGHRLLLCGDHEFRHAIGERRAYRLGRHTLQATGHPAWRRQSLARATVLMARRYGGSWPSFLRLCLLRLGYEGVGVWCAESQRLAKSWALIRGTCEGLVQSATRRPGFKSG
jgi:rhamnosyltransferase